jgi:hypothetical protein
MIPQVKVNWNEIKVYNNGFLHVVIKKDELVSIQSWMEGYDDDATYHIEYHLVCKNNIHSEYWDIENWKGILKALDENNLFA